MRPSEELSKLLNQYQDVELDLYQQAVKSLKSEGIELVFDKVEFLGDLVLWHKDFFRKNKPTFFEFLNHSQEIITGWIGNVGRHSLNRVVLFEQDVYEISFKTLGFECEEKRVFSLEEAKIRLNEDRSLKKDNFLFSLPKAFLNRVSENQSFSMIIRLKKISKQRLDFEEKTCLKNTQEYVQNLINPEKMWEKVKHQPIAIANLPKERLKLWGIELVKSKTNNLEDTIKRLNTTDFGIKNVSHLRFIVDNFANATTSNEDLLKEPVSILAYVKELKEILLALEEKRPLISLPLK